MGVNGIPWDTIKALRLSLKKAYEVQNDSPKWIIKPKSARFYILNSVPFF